MLWSAVASAQPAVIPRSAQTPHDPAQTFATLKRYFSDPAMGMFELESAGERSHTLVAKRSGIDLQTWGQWAYCKLGPEHLLDSLVDGSVTVNVKVEAAGKTASFVTVRADFEGTYGIGSSETTTQCASNGVLEQNILTAAGAATP
jgi:hypothetical protein